MLDGVPVSGGRVYLKTPAVWRLDHVSEARRSSDWLVLRNEEGDPIWLDWPLCVAVVAHVQAHQTLRPIGETAAVVLASVASQGSVIRARPRDLSVGWGEGVSACAVCVLTGVALTVLVFRALGWV